MGRNRRKRDYQHQDIPTKANLVLKIILIALAVVTLRIWHLSVIQHDEKVAESSRPQNRTVIEPAKRGTIRDRFNVPLAINRMQYNAYVVHSQILQIPAIQWRQEGGKKVKHFKRREYINELARLLAEELQLDPDRIEDLIHSKAALYNNLPYVIKEDISEREYYRLKMLEKDWVGIQTQCLPKRYYPLGMVAGDIIGYMGAISREEYEGIIQEIKLLENCLAASDAGGELLFPYGINNREEAEARLNNLIERAYSVNDYVGKTGIEGKFEENLRGYYGKKTYYSDAKGNFLREIDSSKPPMPGKRILLTLSAELQEFSEQLLIQNEHLRKPRVSTLEDMGAAKDPWIKGGAIIAMEPFTGEILAMSSHPRFDPNDFIASGDKEVKQRKNANIRRWFETPDYIAEIWDGKRPLEREMYDLEEERISSESAWLTWEKYLERVLAKKSSVREEIKKIKTLKEIILIQRNMDQLIALTGQNTLYPLFNILFPEPIHRNHGPRLPAVQQEAMEDALLAHADLVLKIKNTLSRYLSGLPSNYDKVLMIDLCRLVIDNRNIPLHMNSLLEELTLSDYRKYNAAWISLETAAKELSKDFFSGTDFKKWRESNQKSFLKEKREEEKAKGAKYPKPYLDLLDKKQEEMFSDFWKRNRGEIVLALLKGERSGAGSEAGPYFDYFITWHNELSQGAHSAIGWKKDYVLLQSAVRGRSKEESLALMHSFRTFQELNRPLYGRYRLIRQEKDAQCEKNLAAAFYPLYGFGSCRSYAYRQASTQGSLFKIITGYEALVQRLRKIRSAVKSYELLNPLVIVDHTHKRGEAIYVGYDSAGKPIPQLYKGGRIPKSPKIIGKVDFLTAFEHSSNPYFSLLTIEALEHPNDLAEAAKKFGYGEKTGIDLPMEISGKVPDDLDCSRNGLYSMAIGQHTLVVTPLQTAVMLAAVANGGKIVKPKIARMIIGKENRQVSQTQIHSIPAEYKGEIFLPEEVRKVLLDGMERVFERSRAASWGSLAKLYADYPEAISDLIDMKGQIVGKSSTGESVESLDLDFKTIPHIYNHTWFGGIVYDPQANSDHKIFTIKDDRGNPELVIVIYLRYGAWGKDTAPLAAQMARKWREIKKKQVSL